MATFHPSLPSSLLKVSLLCLGPPAFGAERAGGPGSQRKLEAFGPVVFTSHAVSVEEGASLRDYIQCSLLFPSVQPEKSLECVHDLRSFVVSPKNTFTCPMRA